MNGRSVGLAIAAFGIFLSRVPGFSQVQVPAGKPEGPGWFLAGSAPDPGGRAVVGQGGVVVDAGGGRGGGIAACTGDIAEYCAGPTGFWARGCLTAKFAKLSWGWRALLVAFAVEKEEVAE